MKIKSPKHFVAGLIAAVVAVAATLWSISQFHTAFKGFHDHKGGAIVDEQGTHIGF